MQHLNRNFSDVSLDLMASEDFRLCKTFSSTLERDGKNDMICVNVCKQNIICRRDK